MKGSLIYITILAFIIITLVILGTKGGSEDNIKINYPQNEVDFFSVIKKAKNQHSTANELQKEGIKNSRNRDICEVLPSSGDIEGWHGIISDIDSTMDGDAIVSILIPEGITITTVNNSFSDINQNTLIKKGTDLFNEIFICIKVIVLSFPENF